MMTNEVTDSDLFSHGGEDANGIEAWWQRRVASFPGGTVNAVRHMPDAATRRMRWLEEELLDLRAENERLRDAMQDAMESAENGEDGDAAVILRAALLVLPRTEEN